VTTPNQNPEQIARDQIDKRLAEAGWIVQDKKAVDFSAGLGIAVREYQTDIGPADYALFVDKKAVGVIEAKPEEWGHKITTVEEQSASYAAAKLKWVNNKEPLPFVDSMSSSLSRFSGWRSRSLSLGEGLTDSTGARDGTRADAVLDRGRRRLFSFWLYCLAAPSS
jgi:type I restriction enzyme R subunit